MSKSVILVGSNTCSPCKMQKKLIEDLEGYNYIGADEYPDLAKKFNVMQVPVTIVFDGAEELARFTGLTPRNKIEEVLKGGNND